MFGEKSEKSLDYGIVPYQSSYFLNIAVNVLFMIVLSPLMIIIMYFHTTFTDLINFAVVTQLFTHTATHPTVAYSQPSTPDTSHQQDL